MLIEFKRPQLEDKELITEYFRKYPSRNCDRTFVNAFLWARFFNAGFAVIEDTLVFEDYLDEEWTYSYPAGTPENIRKAIDELLIYCKEKGHPLKFHSVTPEFYSQLEELYPGQFGIEYNRDWADYVYESEKLATLSGKKYHSKRNHVNKFMATHENWSYEKLSKDNLEECFQMALKWRNANGCEEDEEKNAEMCVTMNSLRLFEELGAVGGVLRVDGEIVAFTIGEEICEDTFVVHIEKAFAEIDGAYPVINQQFVRHECMNYKYVNREDDTGAEGLRIAKMSYRPVFLVEKGLAYYIGE